MQGRHGFTLIEMMIVVAIISILAAIAVPNLLRSKILANEAATIEDMSVIAEAQISYNAAHLTFGDFAALTDDSHGPPFLDLSWDEGTRKNGYQYTMASFSPAGFVCFADPLEEDVSGSKHFRVDTSGVIRFNLDGQPTATDKPVGGG